MKALNRSVAAKQATALVGFWVAWHLYGGFEGIVDQVGMHPSTVWRKVKKFRLAFKEHPDVFKMPGVTIDPAAIGRRWMTVHRPLELAHPLASGQVDLVREPESGLDALRPEWFAGLLERKAAVGESDAVQVVEFGGESLHVLPHGLDGWKVFDLQLDETAEIRSANDMPPGRVAGPKTLPLRHRCSRRADAPGTARRSVVLRPRTGKHVGQPALAPWSAD